MNLHPRTWLVAAALAATLPAQTPGPQQALARAQLLETQEHDLANAQQAYRALLDDNAAADVHGAAALRLGALLWRLDKKDAAKPFLERAVAAGGDAGKEATLILQGQGEDAKLAQERLTKARALVGLYAQLQGGERNPGDGSLVGDPGERRSLTVLAELRPLGAQAAEAIAEFLEVGLRTGRIARYPGKDPVRPRLMCLLWEIGTQPATIALRRWSEPEDLNVRLGAAEGCRATTVAADLEPVLLDYVRDPDPSGEVWRLVVNAVVNLPHERHVELLAAHDAPTRAAGLHALATTWKELTPEQREHVVERHAATIRRATRDADTRVVHYAWYVLKTFAGGPTSATLVFFAEADRYPGDLGPFCIEHRIEADDAWLHALTDAARRVHASSREFAFHGLLSLVQHSQPKWTRASVDDVITLLDLGYGPRGGSDWALPAVRFADTGQLSRLIALLPRAGSAPWVEELGKRPLPQDAFPALRAVLEQCLAGTAMPWNQSRSVGSRRVRGNVVQVRTVDNTTATLLNHAAATLSPDAATWFGELVDRYPHVAGVSAELLVQMSIDGVANARAALRKLLVWGGTEQDELQPHERSLVFAELARTGDVAAIPLFVRAYELGLARQQPRRQTARTRTLFADSPVQAAGISFLGDAYVGVGSDYKPWHAYSDADLVTAWRTLLDSPMLARVLGDFTARIDPTTGAAARGDGVSIYLLIPSAALPVVIERLPRMWSTAADPTAQNHVENLVGSAFHRVTIADVQPDSTLRNALVALFRDENAELAMLYRGLPNDVAREFAPEGRALLRRSSGPGILASLERAGIELGDDDWTAALKSDSIEMRKEALQTLPTERGQRLRTTVEEQLAHENTEVRMRAAYAVQRLYGPDSIAKLLPLLQDQSSEVRKQVREALETLRQDAEQRAFWAQSGSGIDTSARGAAAKLLAQAKAGEPKDQRVLAIRSLAVLGAAESLPYLIDATKDQDGDVATAAREAIAAIHTKSGAPVPANKYRRGGGALPCASCRRSSSRCSRSSPSRSWSAPGSRGAPNRNARARSRSSRPS